MRLVNYTNAEKYKAISKMFLTNNDICILCDCGITRALELRKKFNAYVARENLYNDTQKVNTDDFVNFMKIDVKRIEKYAKEGY